MEEISTIVSSIVKVLECDICLNTSQDLVSIGCGHFFCRTCITVALKENIHATCPLCNKTYTKRSIREAPQRKSIVKAVDDVVSVAGKLLGYQVFSSNAKIYNAPQQLKKKLERRISKRPPNKVLSNSSCKKKKWLENKLPSAGEREGKPLCDSSEKITGLKDTEVETVNEDSFSHGNQKCPSAATVSNFTSGNSEDESHEGKTLDEKQAIHQTKLHQYLKKLRKTCDNSSRSFESTSNLDHMKCKVQAELNENNSSFQDKNDEQATTEKEKGTTSERKNICSNTSAVKNDLGTSKCSLKNHPDLYAFVSSPNSSLSKMFNTKRKRKLFKVSKSKMRKFIESKRRKKSSQCWESKNDECSITSADDSNISVSHNEELLNKLQNMQLEKSSDAELHDFNTSGLENSFTGENDTEKLSENKASETNDLSPPSNYSNGDIPVINDNMDAEVILLGDLNHRMIEPDQMDVTERKGEKTVVTTCPMSPQIDKDSENIKFPVCKSPGWSRIKQMNKDFHFKTFPSLHIQKCKATISPTVEESDENDLPSGVDGQVKVDSTTIPHDKCLSAEKAKLIDNAKLKTVHSKEELISEKTEFEVPEKNTINFEPQRTNNVHDRGRIALLNFDVVDTPENIENTNKNCETDETNSSYTVVPETSDIQLVASAKENCMLESQPLPSQHSEVEKISSIKIPDYSCSGNARDSECKKISEKIVTSKTPNNKASDINDKYEWAANENADGSEKLSLSSDVMATKSECLSKLPFICDMRLDTSTPGLTFSQGFSHKKVRKRFQQVTSSPLPNRSHGRICKRKSQHAAKLKALSPKRSKKEGVKNCFSPAQCHLIQLEESLSDASSCSDKFSNLDHRNRTADIKTCGEATASAHCMLKNNNVSDNVGKTKVIKRFCLTLEEIETYFESFYKTGRTEVISSLPLPSSDLLLQLNVSDETLNISVLKVLKEKDPSVCKLHPSFDFLPEQNDKDKVGNLSSSAKYLENSTTANFVQIEEENIEHKNKVKGTDSWFHDEDGSLPETQPVHFLENDNTPLNGDINDKALDKHVSKALVPKWNGAARSKPMLNNSCSKDAINVQSFNEDNNMLCNDEAALDKSTSLFVNDDSKNNSAICLGSKKLSDDVGISIVSHKMKTIEEAKVTRQSSHQNIELSTSQSTEEEINDDDLTASLLESKDVSLISPTYDQNHIDKNGTGRMLFNEANDGSLGCLDSVKTDYKSKNCDTPNSKKSDFENEIPQTCPESQEDANFQEEIDPFADTDECFQYNSIPAESESKIEDLFGADDFLSDPDMIFADELVAPLKNIPGKFHEENIPHTNELVAPLKNIPGKFHEENIPHTNELVASVNDNLKSAKSISKSSNMSNRSLKFSKLSRKRKAFKQIARKASDDSDDALEPAIEQPASKVMQQQQYCRSPSVVTSSAKSAMNRTKLNDSRTEMTTQVDSSMCSQDISTGAVDKMKLEIQQMMETIKTLKERINAEESDESADSSAESHSEKDRFRKLNSISHHKEEEADGFSDDSKESSDLFMGPISPTPPRDY